MYMSGKRNHHAPIICGKEQIGPPVFIMKSVQPTKN